MKRKYKKKFFLSCDLDKGQICSCQNISPRFSITAKDHFERPYIKGDIQLGKHCSGGGVLDCLKTGCETKKCPLFKGCLITTYNTSATIKVSLDGYNI